MSWPGWTLGLLLVAFSVTRVFKVCMLTFQKSRTVLSIVGIVVPFLRLIGAVLPPKESARYDEAPQRAYQQQMHS